MSPALVASLGPGQVRPGSAGESVDTVEPRLVITARSAANVSTIINEARANNLAIIPCGGGTQLYRGNTPRSFDIRLSLTGLANIIERRSEDMTVTAEAGVTLAQLNRALASGGQRLAVDPAAPQQASLGGIVAANRSGGLSHAFGTPRDLVLGMSVIDGRGRNLDLGGRVVKNVAGYDLPRLFAGSWGTLGVITEITFRTHPLAERATTLSLSFEDSTSLERARAALFGSELPLAAMDFAATTPSSSWTLHLRIEGTGGEIDYQVSRVHALCGSLGESEDAEWVSPVHHAATGDFVVIAATRPGRGVAVAERMLAAACKDGGSARIGTHAGLGLVYLGCAVESADHALALLREIRTAIDLYQPRLMVSRCPVAMKPSVDVWGPQPGGFGLMQAVKKNFDPDGVFCPGRFVGRM